MDAPNDNVNWNRNFYHTHHRAIDVRVYFCFLGSYLDSWSDTPTTSYASLYVRF